MPLSEHLFFFFMSLIARIIFKIWGWNIYNTMPSDIRKGLLIMAPHTSNLDFVLGRLCFYKYNMKANILIKKESFKGIMGPVLRWLGGIPLDRGHSQNTVKKVTDHFDKSDKFFLLITPEGTRRKVNHWKKGFYFIALTAKVPIIMAFLDYKKKEGGIGAMLYPTGNFEEDFKIIEDFYRQKTARYPEKFNLSPENTIEKS